MGRAFLAESVSVARPRAIASTTAAPTIVTPAIERDRTAPAGCRGSDREANEWPRVSETQLSFRIWWKPTMPAASTTTAAAVGDPCRAELTTVVVVGA